MEAMNALLLEKRDVFPSTHGTLTISHLLYINALNSIIADWFVSVRTRERLGTGGNAFTAFYMLP